ncbi:MAG: N-acetylmuramoyl-L-alanine amidase [Oscillospiraceae bacterium]|nr:N-acetylmuramoyl-L-alanine amidase [Oscillospiraceae bacterium]
MKEKRTVPLIIFLILSSFILTGGFYLADVLPHSLSNKITEIINIFHSDDKTPSNPVSSGEFDLDFISADVKSMPKNVNAVWLDLERDISENISYGELCREAESYFENFMNYLTSVIYLRPDYSGKFSGFTDAYQNQVDVLREYFIRADNYGYFKILVIDGKSIYNNGELSFESVRYYLTNYSFDAVLLSKADIDGDSNFLQAAEFFARKIKAEFGEDIFFGAELPILSDSSEYASGNTQAVLSLKSVDFALIEGSSMENSVLPFGKVMSYWNALAKNFPNIVFYCKHRNDLVCSNDSDWGSYTEISSQVRYLWDCESFKGSVFYRAYSLKRNFRTSSQRLSYLLFEGSFDDLAISQIKLENDTVKFSGSASEGHKVILNGETISKDPTFSYSASLMAGKNIFSFFSCGKTLTYNIYNNSRVVYAVYPEADFLVNSGEVFSIAAVCIDEAEPVCMLNGNTYEMTKISSSAIEDVPDGYSVFACSIKIIGRKGSNLELGSAVIYAELSDGSREKAATGKITVLKSENDGFFSRLKHLFSSEPEQIVIPENPDSVKEKISPYRDNGLGTALMCKIINDDTETIGKPDEKNTYHADYSTLPAGTIDYIKDMTVSEAGYLRYELMSGMTVYGVNCEIINNGYILPLNGVSVSRVDDSAANSTDIYFNSDWFVPVTVKCKPQTYSNGYGGYSFNISAFSAEYIEIKFYYTDKFYNTSLLDFSENSPFSNAELYTAGEDSMILRLYLKKTGQFYGYDIFMDENGQIVLSFKKHVDGELNGKVIMLDPGHGGLAMTGTSVNDNSVAEEAVTLSIALKAKEMLENMGAQVILTRESDIPLTLSDRAEILSEQNPDIFISIHCDGTESREDSGTHSFYFRPYSMPLADEINKSLANVYKTHIYTPNDQNYNKIDKSIKFYPFYVIRLNQCPAVLVETGFMTNEAEGQLLILDNTQYWLAYGISEGIKNYFAANY